MTIRIVHRPTRTTLPVAQPEPTHIAPPPSLETDQASGPMPLQFLLPVLGASSSMVMMVVLRNGQPLFLVVAALVFLVAVIGGAGFALSVRGRGARLERIRRGQYLTYLEAQRRSLAQRADEDRISATTAHPAPDGLAGIVGDATRLWERRRGDDDYLATRIGLGTVEWFDLSVPPPESPIAGHDSYLAAEADLLVGHYSAIPSMPVTVDLKQSTVVAVIGPRETAMGLVRSMLAQLACHHGPDDLILAGWFPQETADDWMGFDLLPHTEDPTLFDGQIPARRVARDPDELRHVLGATLADRLSLAYTARRSAVALPPPARLVIVGDGYGAPAKKFSDAEVSAAELGVTVIHVLADRLDEPDDVDVRIVCDEDGGATVTTAPGRTGQLVRAFIPDQLVEPVFTATARALAPLRLSEGMVAPEEQGAPDLGDLISLSRPDHMWDWSARSPENFLRVAFGHDDHGTPVWLDLKESAQLGMGPHGLCVGATGSGKSEMLRTLIVSLVTTHSPEDLALVLVDYKGGAAFAPFHGLPHLAGLIDNLADDPHLTTRARASIAGEVVRRQRMLKDAGSLPSIGAYRAARANRPELEPMPHLLVVIDEFGELLTAEPEFVDLFLQIGRIGRSIGVHLLLASQRLEAGKLRGLDTYLSYRLGLRTFSEAESQLVLGNADAYRLPALPGYGYLKVDTSVYSRFRAGYVSGPQRNQRRPDPVPGRTRVRVLGPYNDSGRQGANDRIRGLVRADAGPNLLDTVVDQLRNPERLVPAVWLPPLPDRVAIGPLVSAHDGFGAVMGLVDDPERQQQEPWWLDLTKSGGHIAIIGAPGAGRTTALRSLAVSLALTMNPDQVAIYGLDLGGGGLGRLEGFPHVGGIATRADRDRVVRLVEELTGMLNRRETVMRANNVESVSHLRSLHSQRRLPALPTADIVVLIDGYGQLRSDFPELDDAMATLITRSASFGIHLVLAMNRWSDLRIAHQSLIGTRMELRLNDPSDSTINRKLSGTLTSETPGRVLLDSGKFAHVGLPVLDLVDDDQIGEALTSLAQRSAASWNGPSAAPIRLLPTDLSISELPDVFDAPDIVPIGLRQDTMDTAYWDLMGDDQHLLVLGDSRSGKTTALRTIITGLIERFDPNELAVAVIDARGRAAAVVPDEYVAAHATSTAQAAGLARSIAAELEQRPARSQADRQKEPRIVVVVDDHDIIAAGGVDPLEPLLSHLPAARDLRLHLIITRPVAGASRAMYQASLAAARDTGGAVLILSGDRSEGPLVGRTYAERMPPGRGRYIRRGSTPFVVQAAHTDDSDGDGARQPE